MTPNPEPEAPESSPYVVVITRDAGGDVITNITNFSVQGLTRTDVALTLIRAAAEVASIRDEVIPTRDAILERQKREELRGTHPASFAILSQTTGEVVYVGAQTFAEVAPRMAALGWTLTEQESTSRQIDVRAEADAGLCKLSHATAELLSSSGQ